MKPRDVCNLQVISASLAIFVSATLFASCFGVSKSARYWRTIGAYKSAAAVEHHLVQGNERRHWNLELSLPSRTRVSVRAADGPFMDSNITVKYSDEAGERFVYKYGDYVYPADIRVEGNVLYALVDGLAAGIWRHTRLIVYDLSTRKKLRDDKVDPKDLK